MAEKNDYTALVTGAAGFVGSHLVDALIAKNVRVIGFDDFSQGNKGNLTQAIANKAFQLIEGDIRDYPTLERYCRNVDVVFHLAAVTRVAESIENPRKYLDINTLGTLNVLIAALKADVKRLIFASTAAVYGEQSQIPVPENVPLNPISPYGVTKVAGELLCQTISANKDLETVILRFFNIYGSRQSLDNEAGVVSIFLNQAPKGQALTIFGDGHQTRDFIFIEDAVDTLIQSAIVDQVPSGPVNVGTGHAVSILELAEEVQRLFPSNPPAITYENPRPGDIYHSVAKIDRMKQELHYTPQHDLRKGLQKTTNIEVSSH